MVSSKIPGPATLPTRSPGVLVSWLGDEAVAFDLVTETAHHLNVTAGALLVACDGSTGFDDAINTWAETTGADPAVIAADVKVGLDALRGLELVGRTSDHEAPTAPVGCTAPAPEGSVSGAVHKVLDWAITFRSRQPELLETVDAFLGTGADKASGKSLVFDIDEQADDIVVLVTDYEWMFPSLTACLNQLTSVMNEYAVWTHTCVALHAGAVRSPTGEIVVLPAESGAGKSTLTAAFVRAGWDYLGDEAIGVRAGSGVAVGYPKRLAVDASSRALLGLPESDASDNAPEEIRSDVVRLAGDVGPISRVILPTYEPTSDVTVEGLSPTEAVDALLSHTLNLAGAGQGALDAVCDLAANVPVQRLTHGDAHSAVVHLSVEPAN